MSEQNNEQNNKRKLEVTKEERQAHHLQRQEEARQRKIAKYEANVETDRKRQEDAAKRREEKAKQKAQDREIREEQHKIIRAKKQAAKEANIKKMNKERKVATAKRVDLATRTVSVALDQKVIEDILRTKMAEYGEVLGFESVTFGSMRFNVEFKSKTSVQNARGDSFNVSAQCVLTPVMVEDRSLYFVLAGQESLKEQCTQLFSQLAGANSLSLVIVSSGIVQVCFKKVRQLANVMAEYNANPQNVMLAGQQVEIMQGLPSRNIRNQARKRKAAQ